MSAAAIFAPATRENDPDEGSPDMAWTKLRHTREQVNAAANALVAYETISPTADWESFVKFMDRYSAALPIINNWRASHSFPLNTFRMNLNRTSASVDGEALTAQRIKRMSSISLKLQRFPDMKLSQMQD